jgi:glucose/arabinose dehydrogenase
MIASLRRPAPAVLLAAVAAVWTAGCSGSDAPAADARAASDPVAEERRGAGPGPGAPRGEEGPPAAAPGAAGCDPDDGGLTLAAGFCALVVADGADGARHVAVAPNGDVYVALRGEGREGAGGGVLALRDTTGDGKADVRIRFGPRGGTGLLLENGRLWFAPNDAVLRWTLAGGRLAPEGEPETVVSGLPWEPSHAAKTIALGPDGGLFVNVGSPSNACQDPDREPGVPGRDPCPELETRAGIWRFDAARAGQTSRDGERFATGLRNVTALAVHPESGALYGLQHGRDQLHQLWPDLYTERDGAEKPSEEFVRIDRGDDFGWPYCYHDPELGRLVLAPEYGGDGREAGRCAGKEEPLAAFPAHWAPIALLFPTGGGLPEEWREGAFISFHGSWNRAPRPQAGYRVVFLPLRDGRPAGPHVTFADGFAGPEPSPDSPHRPTGLAQGPDGSIYVADDKGGRIWRILPERGAAEPPGAGD